VTKDRVRTAEFEVDRARARLLTSLNDVSRQFEPHRLMGEVWEKAKDKGADLAEDAVDAVSRRPVAAGAVVAGIIAFLARDSLIDAAGKLFKGAKRKSRRRPKPAQSKAEGATRKAQTEAAE
jgi:hypothetical protein